MHMEHKRCYIYEPDDVSAQKRRRIEPAVGLHKSWQARRKFFDEQWKQLEHNIEEALTIANNAATESVQSFMRSARSRDDFKKLPVCIVSVEPGSRARDVVSSLASNNSSKISRHAILHAADAPDLKSALKKIVRGCGETLLDELDDQAEEQPRKHRPNTLAYDLQTIADEIEDVKSEQCLITLMDAEAFRPEVLSELLEYLTLWLDRIPFVLVICCAVPIDMLQRALTQRALRKIDSEVVYAASRQAELEIVLDCTIDTSWRHLFIGPQLMRSFLQRQHDYLADVSTFISSWKYAAMCAHYANALLDFSLAGKKAHSPELFAAVRSTASFRRLIELRVDNQESSAEQLLDDNKKLQTLVQQQLDGGVKAMVRMYKVVRTLVEAHRRIMPERPVLVSSLWLQCLSGTLRTSTTVRHFFLGIRKASPELLAQVLALLHEHLTESSTGTETDAWQRLQSIIQSQESEPKPASYNADVASWLERYLSDTLVDPKQLPFNEIFLYDSLTPCRETLTPRPRHAIERALATPHDYLDCGCCAPENVAEEGSSLSATQPATAILYQLYLESGNLMNVHDAWQAFSAVLEDEKEDELKMALFQRSLADLRHLGAVKSTRRRVDHIAKTVWKGL